MNSANFLAELKRRNVYKVAVAYLVVSWLLIQAASILFPTFDAPPSAMKVLVVVLAIGFPIALAFSWAFEITPEGLKFESEIDPKTSIAQHTGKKIIGLTVTIAVLAAGLFAYQQLRPHTSAKMEGRSPARNEAPTTASSVANIPEKSIAVLPFDNLSHDPDNAYFSEGIQDEILTRLAKVTDLKVISRTSTQRLKSTPNDLPQIAQQLGVANILEGSVQKAGDQVRVNVQLIKATTDAHLWADTYDRKLTDIFAVESEIARTVAETLQAKLTGAAPQVLSSKPTENQAAYELYLKGRHFWNRRTEADIKKALHYFQEAVAKDPSYALALVGVADSYAILPNYSNDPPKAEIEQALAAARKAIELDDSLAEAHTALANALGADFQFAASEIEFKRAFAMNPNYASAHQWYGELLQSLGRFDEAIAELRRAHELDPLSMIINVVLASTYYSAGRMDEATQQLARAIELDPSFTVSYWLRGQIDESRGQFAEAIADYKKASISASPEVIQALIACVYVRSGETAKAQEILKSLIARSQQTFLPNYFIAQVQAMLGNKDEAIRLLEKSYDERSIPVGGAGIGGPVIDSRFDSLRGNPRFQSLIAKFSGGSK